MDRTNSYPPSEALMALQNAAQATPPAQSLEVVTGD